MAKPLYTGRNENERVMREVQEPTIRVHGPTQHVLLQGRCEDVLLLHVRRYDTWCTRFACRIPLAVAPPA